MKIAVSGASGFLGRPLVKRLVEKGHQIVALGRNPEAMAKVLPEGAVPKFFDATKPVPDVTWDRQGAVPPEDLLAGCDAVVNLAGELIGQRWTPEVKQRIRESRLVGTRALAEAACKAKTVRTFISASAAGYYGARGPEPLDESAPPGDDFLAQVCRDWEAATAPAKACGIRVVIPRIGLVLHPEGAVFQRMLPVFKAGVGGRLGRGDQYMSWIHRDDAVELIVHLLHDPRLEGPVNATAPEAVTNAEFTKRLGAALHRPTFFPVPTFALKLAFGEMSEAVLTGQRVVPKRATEAGFSFKYPKLDDALKDLLG